MKRHDIVIIGAGPAGSAAAYETARLGLRPLLIEKDDSPGAMNACGGMASYAFRDSLGLSDYVIEQEIRRTILRIDGARADFFSDRPMYISFRRSVFDAFLTERAVKAGAELAVSVRAVHVDPCKLSITLKDRKTSRRHEVTAQIIIFADGPKTLAGKAFGIGHIPGPHTRQALYWKLDGTFGNNETMEIFVDTSAHTTGYFWIFPKRDSVQVGVGGPLQNRGAPLNERLAEFINDKAELRGRNILRKGLGLIPGEYSHKLVADGAMAIGDAAGLVNPITGGGIAYALLSGKIAGRVAALAVKSGRTGHNYLQRYPIKLYLTPHYLWLAAMTLWRRRVDNRSPSEQAPAYGRMLKQYFTLFRLLHPLTNILLG